MWDDESMAVLYEFTDTEYTYELCKDQLIYNRTQYKSKIKLFCLTNIHSNVKKLYVVYANLLNFILFFFNLRLFQNSEEPLTDCVSLHYKTLFCCCSYPLLLLKELSEA